MIKEKINNQITSKKLRVIYNDKNLGIMSNADALALARKDNLDLVEISSNTNPPVCKILNYGKFKYQQSKKKKGNVIHKEKEIKIGVQIDSHDLDVKINHINEFLDSGYIVKVTIILRGRQKAHPELGDELAKSIVTRVPFIKGKINNFGQNIVFFLEK